MPILHAPILEQAGFVKGALEPVINYVARLNGVDQYWQLSEPILIGSNDDFEVEITAVRIGAAWGNLISGSSLRVSARGSGGRYSLRADVGDDTNGVNTADNTWPSDEMPRTAIVSRVDGVVSVKLDGIEGTTTTIYTGVINMARMGRDAIIGGDDYLNGYVKNLKVRVNGTLTHEIPLTNKDQGATQLPTAGNVSATMVGYTGDEWEEV